MSRDPMKWAAAEIRRLDARVSELRAERDRLHRDRDDLANQLGAAKARIRELEEPERPDERLIEVSVGDLKALYSARGERYVFEKALEMIAAGHGNGPDEFMPGHEARAVARAALARPVADVVRLLGV